MVPDAVNQPDYPSQILRPGGEFRQQIVWRFFNTPASTGSSQGSCQAKSAGCKQCKGGKCTACTRSSDIPDPKTSKVGGVGGGDVGRPTAGVLHGNGAECRAQTAAHQRSLALVPVDAACLQCRAKTCAEANPGCSACKTGNLNVCTKCQRTHSLVSKTKKASQSGEP